MLKKIFSPQLLFILFVLGIFTKCKKKDKAVDTVLEVPIAKPSQTPNIPEPTGSPTSPVFPKSSYFSFASNSKFAIGSFKFGLARAELPNLKFKKFLSENSNFSLWSPPPIWQSKLNYMFTEANTLIIWNNSTLSESRDFGKTFQETNIATKESFVSVEKIVAHCGEAVYIANDTELLFRKNFESGFEKHPVFVNLKNDRIMGIWCNSSSVFVKFQRKVLMAPRDTMVFSETAILPPKVRSQAFVTDNIFHDRVEKSMFQTEIATGKRTEVKIETSSYKEVFTWQNETTYVHNCKNSDGVCFSGSALEVKPILSFPNCGFEFGFRFVALVAGRILLKSGEEEQIKLCIGDEKNLSFAPIEVDDTI